MAGCWALIVAAGRGQRAGAGLPKQYREIAGQPMLARVVGAFAAHPQVKGVLVVIHPDDRPLYDAAMGGLALPEPVAGGPTRQASVRLGLTALVGHAPDTVLIHDAARPFVDAATIGRVIAALSNGVAALPALPLADTLKRGKHGAVTETVPRDGLYRAQTPQGFAFEPILRAHEAAAGGPELTDDAAVAEAAGLDVRLVPGAETNRKVTLPEDFAASAPTSALTAAEPRVGNGVDVHAFGPGHQVVLCGVPIPHARGLDGHSDADVGLHALTDAVLGAIGAGDIGKHFPPGVAEWKGAPSDLFLRHAAALVRAKGGRITHVDVTLICEAPRIGTHIPAMTERVAAVLGIAVDRVSVKATTTEKLGFTGRREGIAAQATATIML